VIGLFGLTMIISAQLSLVKIQTMQGWIKLAWSANEAYQKGKIGYH